MNIRKLVCSAVVSAVAAVAVLGTTQAAGATTSPQLADELGSLWTAVLQTPSAQNSFGTGGSAYECWNLGGNVVAPFGPSGATSCTVTSQTRLFVAGATVECSTPWEVPAGTDLASCAADGDARKAPKVSVDGLPVALTEVATSVQPVRVPLAPARNVFGLPGGTGQFAAHGWVILLDPLTPGEHVIVGPTFRTTITVRPAVN